MQLPPRVFEELQLSPDHAVTTLADLAPPSAPFHSGSSLEALIQLRVLPELAARHRVGSRHAHPRAAELAGLLLRDAVEPMEKLLGEVVTQEGSLLSLRIALLELTARLLGNMWLTDICTETDVVVALCLLQSAVRRLASVRPVCSVGSSPGRVLVAPLPGETHLLGVVLASDTLYEMGWGVTVSFPADAGALVAQLRSEPFDRLHLALSDVFRREESLPLLRGTVEMTRSASLNRSMKVTVSGRMFAERTIHPGSVGADVMSPNRR